MNFTAYFIRRIFAILPTFIGITLITFIIINLAPGGPVEQAIRKIRFANAQAGAVAGTDIVSQDTGVNEEIMNALKAQYGFDKPVIARYLIWLRNILRLDFGISYTYQEPVIDVIVSKMPVSVQFGVISFFMTYLVCIPLGIYKAVKDGTNFDYLSSFVLFLMYSIPGFMLAVVLIVLFGGGSFFDLIPIGGLYSDNYFQLPLWGKVWDRIHHFIAPLICYMIGSFTTLTMLMKNSIIEEISKDYCRTARAKGLDERTVYLRHALRNALIPIATGIGGFLGIFFAGSLLLETIFNLDGMGLLGYSSVLSRDFNVIMGDLVIISFITLFGNILSDLIYVVVDPRLDFSAID